MKKTKRKEYDYILDLDVSSPLRKKMKLKFHFTAFQQILKCPCFRSTFTQKPLFQYGGTERGVFSIG